MVMGTVLVHLGVGWREIMGLFFLVTSAYQVSTASHGTFKEGPFWKVEIAGELNLQ